MLVDYDKLKTPAQLRLELVKESVFTEQRRNSVGNLKSFHNHLARMHGKANADKFEQSKKAMQANKDSAKLEEQFAVKVKKNLISEVAYSVMEPIIEEEKYNAHQKGLAMNMFQKLCSLDDPNNLLHQFEKNSIFLSSCALEINRAYKEIMEDTKSKNKCSKCGNYPCNCGEIPDYSYTVDKDIAEKYLSTIKNSTPERLSKIISKRVTDAITNFVNQNTDNKLAIKQIYATTQSKMKKAPTEEIQQEMAMTAKKEVAKIYDQPTNLYGMMVRRVTESITKKPDVKTFYAREDGTLNMAKIMNDVEVMYTVLETCNCLGIINVDKDYARKIIDELTD